MGMDVTPIDEAAGDKDKDNKTRSSSRGNQSTITDGAGEHASGSSAASTTSGSGAGGGASSGLLPPRALTPGAMELDQLQQSAFGDLSIDFDRDIANVFVPDGSTALGVAAASANANGGFKALGGLHSSLAGAAGMRQDSYQGMAMPQASSSSSSHNGKGDVPGTPSLASTGSGSDGRQQQQDLSDNSDAASVTSLGLTMDGLLSTFPLATLGTF
jgi:hypothetical protein